MSNEYQTDIDECKKWMAELLDYANSLRDIIRVVNGKTVEQMSYEAVKAAEDLAEADEKSNTEHPEAEREALKQLRETNIFADKLLDVIDTARKNGWYRIELGYLKVNENGILLDRRIANTKAIASKTGERALKLTSYSRRVG